MFGFALAFNIGFIAVGGLLVKGGLRNIRLYSKMRNLSTSRVRSLAAGEVELKGTIAKAQEDFLISPVQRKKSALYWLTVYEWSDAGKRSGWRMMHSLFRSVPFCIADETGKIFIEAEHAFISTKNVHSVEDSRLSPEVQSAIHDYVAAFSKSADANLSFSDGRFRLEEVCISEGDEVYLLGNAIEPKIPVDIPGVQRLVIGKHDGTDLIICTENEEYVKKRYLDVALVFIALGAFLIFFGLVQVFNILDWLHFMRGFQ